MKQPQSEQDVADALRDLAKKVEEGKAAREEMYALAVDAYRKGMFDVRGIMNVTGLSHPTVYKILDDAGVERPRLK